MGRQHHQKNQTGGAGKPGKTDQATLRHQGPVAPAAPVVYEHNGPKPLSVMARVTEIAEGNFGKFYGYGTIETGSGEAQIGELVYVADGAASRMNDRGFGRGSLVAVKVVPQQGGNDRTKHCKWVATFFIVDNPRNVSINLDDGSVQTKQQEVLTRARKAMTAYRDLGDTATSDQVAKKAFDDLRAALADKNVDAILSSCGRLAAQTQHLKAQAEARMRVEKDLARQEEVFDSEADALLAEFADVSA